MYHKDPYINYYINQGQTGYGAVYAGTSFQKGHGLGSFLAGIFRSALPFIRPAARYILPEIGRTGSRVLSNILENNVKPREAFKEGFTDLSKTLIKKMQRGNGVGVVKSRKRKLTAVRSHSTASRLTKQKRRKFKSKSRKRKVSKKRKDFFS